jgi:hypothetical protein
VAYAAQHFPLFDAPPAVVKDISESSVRPPPRVLVPAQLRGVLQRRPGATPPPPLPTSAAQASALLAFCLSCRCMPCQY